MVENQKNNLAILCPFLDLREFSRNRGLTFETTDSDFCDLLNELFYLAKTSFDKNQILSDDPVYTKI